MVNTYENDTKLDVSVHIPRSQVDGESRTRITIIMCGSQSVEIIAAESKIGDESKENQCLTNVMIGKEQYSWRGPILILRYDTTVNSYADAQGEDLDTVTEYFTLRASRKRKWNIDRDIACNFGRSITNAPPEIDSVMSIIISCSGDMREFGHAKFSQVSNTPFELLTSFQGNPLANFALLDLELVLKLFPSGYESNTQGKGEDFRYHRNNEIESLMIETDPTLSTWGQVGKEATGGGTYLVCKKGRRAPLWISSHTTSRH